jgi:hypothetical protein
MAFNAYQDAEKNISQDYDEIDPRFSPDTK